MELMIGDPEKGGRLLMQTIYLETLPIPQATPAQQDALLISWAKL